MRKDLLIIHGTQCSGKSTFVSNFFDKDAIYVYGTRGFVRDIARKQLAFFAKNEPVKDVVFEIQFKELYKLLDEIHDPKFYAKKIVIIVQTDQPIELRFGDFVNYRISILQSQFIPNYR